MSARAHISTGTRRRRCGRRRARRCVAALDVIGNPSSPHAEGRRARAIVEDAREQVAALVGAKPAEVVFTSGGTEANNAVLAAGWDTIVVAGIEHDSVLAPARASRARIVESAGRRATASCAPMRLRHAAGAGAAGRALLSLQLANNETGVLQPVAEAGRCGQGAWVCSCTPMPCRPRAACRSICGTLGVDCLTLSAHKIGGPKGIGALVIREGASLPAFIAGGGQERRRRAGTENVAAIAGFGAAAEAAQRDLGANGARARAARRLEARVRRSRRPPS